MIPPIPAPGILPTIDVGPAPVSPLALPPYVALTRPAGGAEPDGARLAALTRCAELSGMTPEAAAEHTARVAAEERGKTGALPACCIPSPAGSLAEALYCAYNAAGDPATAGRNYRGEECPPWRDLPENVRAKWEGVACIAWSARTEGDPGSYGWALVQLRAGRRVRLAEWNGRGMFVFHACPRLEEESPHLGVPPLGDLLDLPRRPCLCMRDAQGSIVFGWLASQTDVLAVDWELAD